ncbi:MAG: phosphotransferase, partial [Dermatophilaceae bacterium]
MTTDTRGRFTEAAMTAVMREVAGRIGASDRDAHLLQLTNNAVFALPTARLVIRITRSHELHARVEKVARLGAWFATRDAPTIRLATGFDQPVRVGPVLASIWAYVPPAPPGPTVADLGAVLREFHRLGRPPFAVPKWDPVGDARSRLADAEGLRDADRDQLLDWCDRLAPRITAFTQRADTGLVHGDA